MDKESKAGRAALLALAALMAILLAVGCLIPTENVRVRFARPLDYSGGWYDADTGRFYRERAILVQPGQTLRLTHRLPATIGQGTCLCLRNAGFHLTAMVGNCTIYEMGYSSPLVFGRELGRVWCQIPLGTQYGGHTVNLILQNKDEQDARRFDLYSVTMGTSNEVDFSILSTNFAAIVESGAVLLIALMLCVYAFLLFRYHVPAYRYAILYLGLLALDCGLWFISDGELAQFFFDDASFRYQLSYFAFLSVPVFVVLFFREIVMEYRRLLTRVLLGYAALAAVLLGLYAANLVHISRSVSVIHLYMMFIIFVLLGACVQAYRTKRCAATRGPLLAFGFLMIGGVANLYLYYTTAPYDNTMPVRRALLLFLIVLSLTTVRESLRQFKDVLAAEHYRHLAYVDSVTGGNTRQRFEEDLAACRQKQETGDWLLYLNLVGFKVVNEALGRARGNELLKDVYAEIASCLAPGELLCHLGNANFFMLIRGGDAEHLHRCCVKIRHQVDLCRREKYDNVLLNLEFCACPANWAETLDQMLDHALMARNNPQAACWNDPRCYLYNRACSERLLEDRRLEDRLDEALKNREFQLYLQPKISPADGVLRGAEALVRWQPPGEPLMPPGKFVPLFERAGVLYKLDLYMFERVCEQIAAWLAAGTEPPLVSVNVSKAALLRPDFFRRYEAILHRSGIPARYLEFEITESVAYNHLDGIQAMIASIHAMGARCSMDDFGTSYSNLNALNVLAFDTVKMDKCFFDNGFPTDAHRFAMVDGLIRLLHNLKLEVVAEGIETQGQQQAIRALGCDLVQGYFYSKPLPVGAFEAFMAQPIHAGAAKP